MRGSHLQSHVTFWLHGHVSFWLYGHVTNSKNLYLLFRNTYGHQTWQSSNLQWANTTFKVTWPFYYVITWQIQKTYICSSTIPMATKLLQNHVNFWWRGHMTLEKTYIYTYKIPMATKLTLGKSHLLFYVIFWYHGHVKNGKPYNCLSTIPRASKFGRELT